MAEEKNTDASERPLDCVVGRDLERGPKVVELQKKSLMDVPTCLRSLADKIENGKLPASSHCIVVSEDPDGEITMHGYGEVGVTATEVGLLQMAVLKMATS